MEPLLSRGIKGGMSVVRVQESDLDVWFDVAIQRYSFYEVLELILHLCNVNHMDIFRILLSRFSFSYCFNHTVNLFRNSPIRISKHFIEIFQFQSLQLTIKSTLAH